MLSVLPLAQWWKKMKFVELGDSISRFRFSQSCVGLAGCLCVLYAVFTPFWLKERGLWAEWNDTESNQMNQKDVFNGEWWPFFNSFFFFAIDNSSVWLRVSSKVWLTDSELKKTWTNSSVQGRPVYQLSHRHVCFFFWALLKGDLFPPLSLLRESNRWGEGTSGNMLGCRWVPRHL